MLAGLGFYIVVTGFLGALNSKQTGELRHAKDILKASSGKNPKIC